MDWGVEKMERIKKKASEKKLEIKQDDLKFVDVRLHKPGVTEEKGRLNPPIPAPPNPRVFAKE